VVEAVNEETEFVDASAINEDDVVAVKFETSNFLTPRNDLVPKTSIGRNATASLADGDGNTSGRTGFTQNPNLLSPRIDEPPKEGDDSMKEYVEDNLIGMAGRRSSCRVNSLLFEEDSFLIKREMMR
jgi:hypothetical protein